jgi:hypothetical protein
MFDLYCIEFHLENVNNIQCLLFRFYATLYIVFKIIESCMNIFIKNSI